MVYINTAHEVVCFESAIPNYFFEQALFFHSQSPLHHKAPWPCGQPAHPVADLCMPQLTTSSAGGGSLRVKSLQPSVHSSGFQSSSISSSSSSSRNPASSIPSFVLVVPLGRVEPLCFRLRFIVFRLRFLFFFVLFGCLLDLLGDGGLAIPTLILI